MSQTKELTLSDVAEHNTKKDLYLVIHDKVYDATSFVDEHPGGEEVLLDVGGQDATEAFEDVGHSDEARTILEGLLAGDLKRKSGDPEPPQVEAPKPLSQPGTSSSSSPSDLAGTGVMFYGVLLLGAGLAFGAYKYLQAKSASEGK
ncbi:MAG: hypothetical protein Q9219_000950 [cf. Caloplaca sp. 3 TL-2023]